MISIKRLKIIRNTEGCECCGSDENLTRDHIIPKVKKGDNLINNLGVLCKPCNSLKGSKIISYSELRELRGKILRGETRPNGPLQKSILQHTAIMPKTSQKLKLLTIRQRHLRDLQERESYAI